MFWFLGVVHGEYLRSKSCIPEISLPSLCARSHLTAVVLYLLPRRLLGKHQRSSRKLSYHSVVRNLIDSPFFFLKLMQKLFKCISFPHPANDLRFWQASQISHPCPSSKTISLMHMVQPFVPSFCMKSEECFSMWLRPSEQNAKAKHMPKHTAELAVPVKQDFQLSDFEWGSLLP